MDIRYLTPGHAVSPQIASADMAAIREAGFSAIICNRPDTEVEPELSAGALRRAAEAEGLAFHDNPVANGALGPEQVERQRGILDTASGPVFAYCRSGTRSSIIWALGQAGRQPVDTILDMAAQAGYDLSGLRSQLDQAARAKD